VTQPKPAAGRDPAQEEPAPALVNLGALAEDLMGRALAGVDETTTRAMHDGLRIIKANLKNELNSGA